MKEKNENNMYIIIVAIVALIAIYFLMSGNLSGGSTGQVYFSNRVGLG